MQSVLCLFLLTVQVLCVRINAINKSGANEMKKKTVIAGERSYALNSLGTMIAFGGLGGLCYYFAAEKASENPYGAYLLEILPNLSAIVFGIIFAVCFVKFLTELQFATFSEEGVAFRSVLFKLGKIKWDELTAVRYQSLDVKIRVRSGRRHYKTVYVPRIFIVLQTKDYRRAPQGRMNAKYGEYLRVLPEVTTLTVTDFLKKYRPDLQIERNS